jgi:hypothetical protein
VLILILYGFIKVDHACHHRWNKQVYASFEGVNIDVNSPKAKQIAGKKAEKYGYVIKNPDLVSQRPIDMPNKGYFYLNKIKRWHTHY